MKIQQVNSPIHRVQQVHYCRFRGRSMSLTYRIARLRESAGAGTSSRPPILDLVQFTKQHVIDVTGVAAHQLHNWVARNWLSVAGEQRPGRGKRRLYSGCDVITVAFGLELQPFGMMHVADELWRTQRITNRAHGMLLDPAFVSGRAMAIVPSSDRRGWSYVSFGPGTARSGHDFIAAVIIDVDRLILETLERLLQITRGEHVSPRTSGEADAPWSGDLVAEDYGDEYILKSTLSRDY